MEDSSRERIIPIQLESQGPSVESSVLPEPSGDAWSVRRPRVANVNVPEHIIVCLDVCYDGSNAIFKMEDGTTYSHLNMLKRVLELFVHWKLAINPRSQFALVALGERGARWLLGLTSSARDFLSRLDTLTSEHTTATEMQLADLFDMISRYVTLPAVEGAGLVPPPYVVRLLLLYGRPACPPRLPAAHPLLAPLRSHPYLYTDVLFAHHDDCVTYRCQEVYDALLTLDNGYSYILEAAQAAERVHEHAARLLAHPLQRSPPRRARHALCQS